MAKPDWWIGQFRQAVPHFLVNWYMGDYAEEDVEGVIQTYGFEIVADFETLRVESIGRAFAKKIDPAAIIIGHLENSEDPMVKAMNEEWDLNLPRYYGNNGTKQAMFLQVLYPLLGEYVKNTTWWDENQKEIRKLHNNFRKTEGVLKG
jgi:hypothetical protein